MTPKEIGYYARVSLGFVALSDTNFIKFTGNVITMMTNNASYLTPDPTLADVSAALTTFDDLVIQALGRGRIAIKQRDESRAVLENTMRLLAAYVTGACKGDVIVLLTSGFDAVKVPAPVGVLDAPTGLSLGYTALTGQLLLRFKANRNAKNYSIENSENAEGPWISRGFSTSSRVVLDNLVPGKTYWVRCCAHGTAGPSDWSGPATMMAV